MTVDAERKNRIRLAVYAYAYEIEDHPIISDAEYDRLSLSIDPSISTGHDLMDQFFRESFDPSTGMWIYQHPELDKVKRIYETYYK